LCIYQQSENTVRRFAKSIVDRLQNNITTPVLDAIKQSNFTFDPVSQIHLGMSYRQMIAAGMPLPKLSDTGFKCYSQCDEDGILLYLISALGISSKLSVEICAGDGSECNSANLIINHNWHGLLVDGNKQLVERGNEYFRKLPQTYVYPPKFVHSWITKSGVNDLVASNGFSGDIGLLSLDLDGVDYWIWEALDAVTPSIVIVEYQDILGPDRNWTVPYSDTFSAAEHPKTQGMPNFAGASLGAFVKLGRRKGYRLVGTNCYGYNAFFIKNGLGDHLLPEVDVSTCFNHPKVVWGMRERFPSVKDLPWVEV
jgi:hypothetical protein